MCIFLFQGHPGREGLPGEKGIQVGNSIIWGLSTVVLVQDIKSAISCSFLQSIVTVRSLTLDYNDAHAHYYNKCLDDVTV